MKKLVFIFTLIVSKLAFMSHLFAMDFMVVSPWIPAAPPTARTHAAYVELHNHSEFPKILVSAESENYNMVHIHLSEIKDGIATMTMVEQIEIPVGGMLSLQPGGFHIMLMGPKSDLNLGDEVPITLNFDDGSTLDIKAIVKERHDEHNHTHSH